MEKAGYSKEDVYEVGTVKGNHAREFATVVYHPTDEYFIWYKKIECHKECKNEVYQYRNCKICGDTFPITMGEKLFYEKKGFDLPWKCKDCR